MIKSFENGKRKVMQRKTVAQRKTAPIAGPAEAGNAMDAVVRVWEDAENAGRHWQAFSMNFQSSSRASSQQVLSIRCRRLISLEKIR